MPNAVYVLELATATRTHIYHFHDEELAYGCFNRIEPQISVNKAYRSDKDEVIRIVSAEGVALIKTDALVSARVINAAIRGSFNPT